MDFLNDLNVAFDEIITRFDVYKVGVGHFRAFNYLEPFSTSKLLSKNNDYACIIFFGSRSFVDLLFLCKTAFSLFLSV